MASAHPPSASSSSWFSRNWKWAVPLGCLGAIVAFVAFGVAIVLLVFGVMKGSDVYRRALDEARSSPLVIEALGEPIKPGWYLSGNINVSGSAGDADIAIPISGSKGEGTIYVIATRRAGQWDYEVLEVEVGADGERIDLRGE